MELVLSRQSSHPTRMLACLHSHCQRMSVDPTNVCGLRRASSQLLAICQRCRVMKASFAITNASSGRVAGGPWLSIDLTVSDLSAPNTGICATRIAAKTRRSGVLNHFHDRTVVTKVCVTFFCTGWLCQTSYLLQLHFEVSR